MMNEYVSFRGNNPFGSQAKMLFHTDRLNEYLETGSTWPINIEINLTNRCNLKCKWCINENARGTETLDTDSLCAFLSGFADHGGRSVTFSGGGEPTLHGDFVKIARYAKALSLDVGLMTNGVYNADDINMLSCLSECFSWVRFSLDTIIQEEYETWKGRDCCYDVIRNICNLKELPVKVGVNCNVSMGMKVSGIATLIEVMLPHCDYIQFRPVLPRCFLEEPIELNGPVWSYLETLDNPKINMSNDKLNDLRFGELFPFTSCEGHNFVPILDADGDLKVCMYHSGDSRFSFGNIYKNTYKEIWESNRRKETIGYVRDLDYSSECQVCCKLTELNKFLGFVNHSEQQPDVNFL